jgi:hypothetical protein
VERSTLFFISPRPTGIPPAIQLKHPDLFAGIALTIVNLQFPVDTRQQTGLLSPKHTRFGVYRSEA